MLSFANPLFLYALAGLAVPVIIHLINRERALPLKFSSIRFIPRASLPQEGRRSITDLLLLLLRLLIMAAIILALAGPKWTPPQVLAADEADQSVVFMLDASCSMSGWGSWAAAQAAIEQEIDKLPAESKVGLLIFAQKALTPIAPTTKHILIKDMVQASFPEVTAAHPAEAMRTALQLLGKAASRRIIIVSDFQLSNWQVERWPAVTEDTQIDFVKVGDFEQGNLAILSARAYTATKDKMRVIARLKNFGKEAVDCTVKLDASSQTIEEKIHIAPGQVQQVSLSVSNPEDFIARLRLPEDSYAPDNDYLLWMSPPPPIQMMTVFSPTHQAEKITEIKFVNTAMDVKTNTAFNRYAVDISDVDIDIAAAAKYLDVLFFPGSISYLNDVQLDALRAFLEAGGVAITTPGKSAAQQYRALRESGISQVAYNGHPRRSTDRRQLYHVGWINPESRLDELFDEESSRDLYMMDVYKYIRLHTGKKAQVILKLENGDPLIVRESVGKGSLISSAFAWNPAWSDLPLRFSFLPILRELLDEAVPQRDHVVRLSCGDSIPAEYYEQQSNPGIVSRTENAGIFSLKGTAFEVNISRAESLPERVVLADLRAQMYKIGNSTQLADPIADYHQQSRSLWIYCLLLGTICFFIEVILAGYLDTRVNASSINKAQG